MVYITGDIHGEVLRVSEMVSKYDISPNDIIVILGDVGMNYYGNKKGDRHRKKKLNNLGVPILCIHGNHEMRPETLITYREDQWHGGAVYVEDEFLNLNFAKDGEVYDLEGTKAIAIGGAYSVDKWYRLQRDLHWFPDEQPSNEIKARVEKKLDGDFLPLTATMMFVLFMFAIQSSILNLRRPVMYLNCPSTICWTLTAGI